MGINVVYGNPGAMLAGGLAAGTAKDRRDDEKERRRLRQKLLEQQQRQMPGSRYRQAMGVGQAAGRLAAQPAGTMVDPFDLAQTPEERVQINSQRRANERGMRLGQSARYGGVDPYFVAAPTRDEIRRKQELEDRDFQTRQFTERDELDWWQGEGSRLSADVAGIDKESGGNYSPVGRVARAKLQERLAALEKDRKERRLTPLQWHQARAKIYGEYLSGFNQEEHVTPLEQRPDYERTTEDGLKQRKTPEGGWATVGIADEGVVTKEQVDQGKSRNWRPTPLGGYQQRVIGRNGTVEWVDVAPPKAESKPGEMDIKGIIGLATKIQAASANSVDGTTISLDEAVRQARKIIADDAASQGGQAAGGAPADPGATQQPTGQQPVAPTRKQQQAALPVSWAKTPEGMVPIDGFGKGPVGFIGGSDPKVYVMADGRHVTAPQEKQGPVAAPQAAAVAMTRDEAVQAVRSHTELVKSGGQVPPELSQRAAEAAKVLEGNASGGSVKDRAIAAARAGDPNAQRALDERGIPWRQ